MEFSPTAPRGKVLNRPERVSHASEDVVSEEAHYLLGAKCRLFLIVSAVAHLCLQNEYAPSMTRVQPSETK